MSAIKSRIQLENNIVTYTSEYGSKRAEIGQTYTYLKGNGGSPTVKLVKYMDAEFCVIETYKGNPKAILWKNFFSGYIHYETVTKNAVKNGKVKNVVPGTVLDNSVIDILKSIEKGVWELVECWKKKEDSDS